MSALAQSIIGKYRGNVSCPDYKLILYWVKNHIRYMTDIKQFGVVDFWLFPDQTVATGAEDCDGMSFLVASLLEAAGYDTRVVLGQTPWGYHAWVEMRDEGQTLLTVEATTGSVFSMEEAERIGYSPDIFINPEGCSWAGITVDSY